MITAAIIYYLIGLGVLGYPVHPATKLSIATWNSYYFRDNKGPDTYAFGYDIEDDQSGNVQYRQEERYDSKTVTGSYGYVDPDGNPVVVTYIADDLGYRAKIEKNGSPTQYFPDMRTFTGVKPSKLILNHGYHQ